MSKISWKDFENTYLNSQADFDRSSNMTRTVMTIDKTVRKIQCRDFMDRSTSEKLCTNCDLRYFCGRMK